MIQATKKPESVQIRILASRLYNVSFPNTGGIAVSSYTLSAIFLRPSEALRKVGSEK